MIKEKTEEKKGKMHECTNCNHKHFVTLHTKNWYVKAGRCPSCHEGELKPVEEERRWT